MIIEEKFQNKIQTAVSETESTVKTDTLIYLTKNSFRAHFFRPIEERKGAGNHHKR